MELQWLFGTITIAYLLGSIPFGLLLTRIFGGADIRKTGSGNIGATNVLRSGRKWLALFTLLLDGGKGAAAVLFVDYAYNEHAATLAGLIVVLAHVFPIWLRYKGGKGVATTIGVSFALNWGFALTVCVIWLGAFAISRISSLSAILAICYAPMAAYLLDSSETGLLAFSLAALILYTHRSNIERLLSGKEAGFSKKAA